METVVIQGTKRDAGAKTAKKLRKEGQVPCVIYGGGEEISFSAPELSFRDLVYTPDFKLAEIQVDGNSYKCILKDSQYHPVTDRAVHYDFLRLTDGHPVKLAVPVRFEGVSPGVKVGGKLIQNIRRVRIKTLPEKIVSELSVDISSLELGQSVRVRDIVVPEGIQVMDAPAQPVGTVEIPRALRSATAKKEAEEAQK